MVFTDPNSDSLTYSGSGTTAKGDVVVEAGGSFTYKPTSDSLFVAAATEGDDTDTFTVTVKDGHGGTVAKTITITVTITPAAVTSDGQAALKAAESVITSSVGAYQSANAQALEYVGSLAPEISGAQLDLLMAEIITQMKARELALAAGKDQAAADAKAAITSKLGDLSDDSLDTLKAKLAAIEEAEKALPKPLTFAADARAVVAAQTAGDGKPVLSRVDYTVNPDGTVTGELTFIDLENPELIIIGGVISSPVPSPGNVAIGQFAALPSNQFEYTPGPFGENAQDVTFGVNVIDSDNHLVGFNITIDVTKSSPPATLTDVATELANDKADLEEAIADREAALEAQQSAAQAEAAINDLLAQIAAQSTSIKTIVSV